MLSRKSLAVAVITAGGFYLPQVSAHHALEYIDTSSYTLTAKGEGIAYLLYDHQSRDPNDPGSERWEFTPGISYGVTDWLMVDAHTHYAKFGRNFLERDEFIEGLDDDHQARINATGAAPMLEAAAIGAQVALPRFTDLFDVGLAASVEIPFSAAKRWLGADKLGYEFELILHREIAEHVMITANIINVMEHDGDSYEHEQEWRLGFRFPITPNPDGIAAGVEWEGSFEDSGWNVMPGIYTPITNNAIAKMGLQLDGKEMEARRFHASLMYLF
jgi:hypothetical protein